MISTFPANVALLENKRPQYHISDEESGARDADRACVCGKEGETEEA